MPNVKCPKCGKDVPDQANNCPSCGSPATKVRCPKCGSTNVSVISAASKAMAIAFTGVFSAKKVRSTYQCNDCKNKF